MQADELAGYEPGVCNIGPDEIARRRRAGDAGLLATASVLATLFAVDAPPILRLLAAVPATISASGYIQARHRFCAAYGSLGVFNFGDAGRTTEVADLEARARDRRRAREISLQSLAIGALVGVAAALAPI